MLARKSILRRRARKKITSGFELQLTSMLDILVIIVVFLLKSQSSTVTQLPIVQGLEMPQSQAVDIPVETLLLAITEEGIIFEDQKIVEFESEEIFESDSAEEASKLKIKIKKEDLDESGKKITALVSVLEQELQEQKEVYSEAESQLDADSASQERSYEIAIQADKKIPYQLLKKVLASIGTSGFQMIRFLASNENLN